MSAATATVVVALLLTQGDGNQAAQATPVGVAGGPTVVEPIGTQDDEVHQIGKMLRCPVCQGMPISESPSQMAQAMMARVREMLAEGRSQQEIYDYFTAKYGEWVLLKPKAQGMNLGLWILPVVALLLGAVFVVRSARRPAPAAPSSRPADDARLEDELIRAIRDEVNQ